MSARPSTQDVGVEVGVGVGMGVGVGVGESSLCSLGPMFPTFYGIGEHYLPDHILSDYHNTFFCVFHDSMCLCAKFCANQPIGGAFMYK